ncbi:MAG: FAD:protein FMN transferase [Pirellulales bacterium]|nr:FAD:protein FMN transferase [Pirellulales bacterium]
MILLAILVGVGFWKISSEPSGHLVALVARPERIMGTNCLLAVVVPNERSLRAQSALQRAEDTLRQIEARMSSWLADSEISKLNRARAGVDVSLSPDVIDVLKMAQEAHQQTGGVFDVACRPLIQLWKNAVEHDRLPTARAIVAARQQSRWDDLVLNSQSSWAKKRSATTSVDLGGIAKGYAIDRALAAIRDSGGDGGLVDVGGDVACFGRPADGPSWTADVQDPFSPGRLTTLRLSGGAVCTSGDYARYRTIEGRRYSHIIDPRTGRPAESVPSVTVLAPNAVTADVWATALNVLGPKGIGRLPQNVEALLIVGTAENHKIYCTPGIPKRLEKALPIEPTVIDRTPVGQAVRESR